MTNKYVCLKGHGRRAGYSKEDEEVIGSAVRSLSSHTITIKSLKGIKSVDLDTLSKQFSWRQIRDKARAMAKKK